MSYGIQVECLQIANALLLGIAAVNMLFIMCVACFTAGQKRCMEGRVVQKVDCRPIVSSNYMQLKRTQMIEAARPKRITQQLSSAVKTTFKPVSVHKEEVRS